VLLLQKFVRCWFTCLASKQPLQRSDLASVCSEDIAYLPDAVLGQDSGTSVSKKVCIIGLFYGYALSISDHKIKTMWERRHAAMYAKHVRDLRELKL